MPAPNYITSDQIDGLPQIFTYNGSGQITSIVAIRQYDDGSYTTYTQTYTYPNATTMNVSAWVGVFTP